MLYKLGQTNGTFDTLTPMSFQGVSLEKNLENLLAEHLLDVLFEREQLMPIFQERAWQEEADIYAVNRRGEIVIFELKRGGAGSDAVYQALRYCEKAAHWGYEELQRMLATYNETPDTNLQTEHQEVFELEHPLEKQAFNTKQHLMVVGSASDQELVRNVDYWKSKGLSLDFIPYRIYKIGEEHYFEFFSKPYDQHSNPADTKGVMFDTCRTHIPDSIWYMCENNRVAAFGDQKHIVGYLNQNDIVFLYHKWEGIVAAGRVKSGVKTDDEWDACYRDLEWLAPKPVKGEHHKIMSPSEIKKLLDAGFFWARTIKVPYLTADEAQTLLSAFKLKFAS